MIVVRLSGGLGNQMFQYALGRRLALASGAELKLDITSYESDSKRCYELEHFAIRASVATPQDLRYALRSRAKTLPGLARRLGEAFLPRSWRSFVREAGAFQLDRAVLRCRDRIYLEGCWQHEAYVSPIESELRQEFTPRQPLPSHLEDLPRAMSEGTSVCVHVRRGDYVTDPATSAYHGACPASWFGRAADILCGEFTRPVFFVFSDEPEWALHHIHLPGPTTVVSRQAQSAWEHLHLMTHCRHHIISNSTFGWWGAWLAGHPGQVVLAPRQWLMNDTIDTSGLIPQGWRRL